ncbi:MAG: hypothetical protein AAGH65_10115, partial [Pseudomonadota bacterium]
MSAHGAALLNPVLCRPKQSLALMNRSRRAASSGTTSTHTPGAEARRCSAQALLGVLDQRHSLTDELERVLVDIHSSRDRALVRRLSNS